MQKFKKKNYRIMLSWLSKRTSNQVLRFICLWVVLNHWYKTYYSRLNNDLSDRECIEKIKRDRTVFNRLLNNQNLESSLEKGLINFAKIVQKLKFQNVPTVMFDGLHIEQCQANYQAIIEAIYEFRNKIFHGAVAINDKNVKNLAMNSNLFLDYFIGLVILNPKITK